MIAVTATTANTPRGDQFRFLLGGKVISGLSRASHVASGSTSQLCPRGVRDRPPYTGSWNLLSWMSRPQKPPCPPVTLFDKRFDAAYMHREPLATPPQRWEKPHLSAHTQGSPNGGSWPIRDEPSAAHRAAAVEGKADIVDLPFGSSFARADGLRCKGTRPVPGRLRRTSRAGLIGVARTKPGHGSAENE
jgi:hypothetical protein